MRCPVKKLFVPLCLAMLSGCAYVENRARDAADMITVAAEFPAVGLAASGAYVGFSPSYFGEGHGVGLRSGALGPYEFKESVWLWTIFGKKLSPSEFDRQRQKGYSSDFLSRRLSGGWFNWGQAEVAVGVGGGLRAGVNFCEIADFVVGLAGLDICGDDIAKPQNTSSADHAP